MLVADVGVVLEVDVVLEVHVVLEVDVVLDEVLVKLPSLLVQALVQMFLQPKP